MKKINLPNRLTLLRVAAIPLFVAMLSIRKAGFQYAAAAVFVLACITDALDGRIARSRNLVTNFGAFADPIADKILVMSAYVVLVEQGRMPAWVCIVVLAREFTVSGFRLIASINGKVISAGPLGKIKTVLQMLSVVMLIVFVRPDPDGWMYAFLVMAQIAMYASVVFTVWSGADYIYRNRELIRDM